MARNQEKAQSMLYRFREAQAAELGISLGRSKNERRPRLANSVKDLRECEKWRGDVMREISRKVSKIQDFGLTDYEIRDLNDEINKLLREKNHWENQIIALGGANYKRGNRSMTDDSGKEIPGTRGYKYFGRAKDLPGVKELLTTSIANQEEAENYRTQKYQRFARQPPSYLGDEDEDDGVLLAEEEQREQEMWKERLAEIADSLGEGSSSSSNEVAGLKMDAMPRRKAENLRQVMEEARQTAETVDGEDDSKQAQAAEGPTEDGKRKATGSTSAKAKKAKQDEEAAMSTQDDLLARILPALDPRQLQSPRMPDRKETEAFILRERKKLLKEEYLGKASSSDGQAA